ncbi:conserved hypothetical protein [Streptomyces sviceus ATCC 29083]|uniref:Uncharacterized protein n=1 Tax=Streptomyces sviceus (strain ATCC 29083 / DSM 924 / JCM 4929 / NBRC 13980 / NCIMB 11184 / NRRL 5439 / UC 5370) TaxID=463191 RepID=B5HQ82_STRX2|nr:conserved hypothetical protein [Streptomyces sviceus ATCC 29083]
MVTARLRDVWRSVIWASVPRETAARHEADRRGLLGKTPPPAFRRLSMGDGLLTVPLSGPRLPCVQIVEQCRPLFSVFSLLSVFDVLGVSSG